MKIDVVRYDKTVWVLGAEDSWDGVSCSVAAPRMEEVMLPGPGGSIPYIRIHQYECHGGGYLDCPKHNLTFIAYSE